MKPEQVALRAIFTAATNGDLAEVHRLARLYPRQWTKVRSELQGSLFDLKTNGAVESTPLLGDLR